MKTVALLLNKGELEDAQGWIRVALEFRKTFPKYLFTLVASKPIVAKIDRTCGIDLVLLRRFSRSSYNFVIDCSRVAGRHPGNETPMLDFLARQLKERFEGLRSVSSDLLVEGVYDPVDGYGASTENLVLALDKLVSVRLFPRMIGSSAHLADPRLKELISTSSKQAVKNHLIYLAPTPEVLRGGPHRSTGSNLVLMTMFESTRIPLAWPSLIRKNYKAVITPCDFCTNVFREADLGIPIHTVPLGVRTDFYTEPPGGRKLDSTRPYKFFYSFANHSFLHDRKNGILVLESFIRRYGDCKDVELVIKISGEFPDSVRTMLTPNVKVINSRMSMAQLRDLYWSCDAFLFPSKGEGYAMQPRESMATGMPTVITNFAGLAPIARSDIAYPLEPVRLEPAIYEDSVARRHNLGNPYFGEWAQVSGESLIAAMESIHENQEDALAVGLAASKWLGENETCAQTASSILALFKELK